jgi:hypothetical protein
VRDATLTGEMKTADGPLGPHHFQTFARLSGSGKHLTLNSPMGLCLVPARVSQRRHAVRYKLQLPVIFHWNDGTEHTEGGFTSDVALDGTMILSSKCPPIGSQVRIELLIPSPDKSGEELRVECLGKVTRVVDEPGCSAFGVHGTFDDDHLTRQIVK